MSEKIVIDLGARDDRFLRAAGSVLKDYKITPGRKQDGFLVFEVEGGQKPYVVKVHPEWAGDPTCTCPDADKLARRMTGGYCKHIMAVLLREQKLSCQLLELFL